MKRKTRFMSHPRIIIHLVPFIEITTFNSFLLTSTETIQQIKWNDRLIILEWHVSIIVYAPHCIHLRKFIQTNTGVDQDTFWYCSRVCSQSQLSCDMFMESLNPNLVASRSAYAAKTFETTKLGGSNTKSKKEKDSQIGSFKSWMAFV